MLLGRVMVVCCCGGGDRDNDVMVGNVRQRVSGLRCVLCACDARRTPECDGCVDVVDCV